MHEQTSDFKILTESENGYIGVCNCCQEFNFAFKTILITFQEDEMLQFFDWVMAGRTEQNDALLPHGRNRIYSSPYGNLFLAFNDEELDEIATLYSEVLVMIEMRKILTVGGTKGGRRF